MPLVSLTRATLRKAEFGFLGVTVYTRTQTPLLCGHFFNAGEEVLSLIASRPFRISWLMVGIPNLPEYYSSPTWAQKNSEIKKDGKPRLFCEDKPSPKTVLWEDLRSEPALVRPIRNGVSSLKIPASFLPRFGRR